MNAERTERLQRLIDGLTAAKNELESGLLKEVESLFDQSKGDEPDFPEIEEAQATLNNAYSYLGDAIEFLEAMLPEEEEEDDDEEWGFDEDDFGGERAEDILDD